jgi:hypothetical protein
MAPPRPASLADLHQGFEAFVALAVPVSQQHVRQLMRHHTDDFGFGRRGGEHPPMHEHRTAWERERVDLPEIHRRETSTRTRLLEFRRGGRDQPIAKHLEIGRDLLVLNDGVLLSDSQPRPRGRSGRPAPACTCSWPV